MCEGTRTPHEALKPPSTQRGDRGMAALPAVQTPGASTCSGGQVGTHPAAAPQPDAATQPRPAVPSSRTLAELLAQCHVPPQPALRS